MDDLEFTFNPTPFTDGIMRIAKAMNVFEDKVKSYAQSANDYIKKSVDDLKMYTTPFKNIGNNFKSIAGSLTDKLKSKLPDFGNFFKSFSTMGKETKKTFEDTKKSGDDTASALGTSFLGLVGKIGLVAMAMKGFRAVMNRLPEVQQTFSIAGDILTRNFIWPLRKEIMPYLQKILNWARDHRTTMLQWGSVLVNIFRGILQFAKSIIGALKPIFDVFRKIISDMFGNTVKTMSDVVNIMIFRITVLALFVAEIFKPIFKSISKVILMIYEIGRAFAFGFGDSFRKSLGTWSEVFGDIIKEVQLLIKSIGDLGDSEGWSLIIKAAKNFGNIFGGALKIGLKALSEFATLLRAILGGFEGIDKYIKGGGGAFTKFLFGKAMEAQGIKKKDYEEALLLKAFAEEQMANKKIQPKIGIDNIKNTSINNTSSNVNNFDIKINANTQEEGRAAAGGFWKEIQDKLKKTQESAYQGLRNDYNLNKVMQGY